MANKKEVDVIDADAHVIETERTWDYLEPSEQKFRPLLFSSPQDSTRQYWVIDEKIRGFRFPTFSEQELRDLSDRFGRNVSTPQAARELDDVKLRLDHMDALGIQIQVLHNTFWIEQITTRPDVEAALCRSWNHWLGDIYRKSEGRLRWSCVLPTMTLDEAAVQMKQAKADGAVAVCMRPLEGDRDMTDAYFYPIYEQARNLDLAIAVHIANGNPTNCELYRPTAAGRFAMFRIPTVAACLGLLMSEIPKVFPGLRWGIIEASAQWVPWLYLEAKNRHKAGGREFPQDIFGDYGIFVTCQTNDDIPYVLKYAGEKTLMIGTDYGHTDPSSEVDAIGEFKQMTGLSQESKDRVLHDNPKACYGL